MDKIFVKNLMVPCKIGVTQEERAKKQNVLIGIEVFCNLTNAGIMDDISKSMSYSEIKETVITLVSNGEFKLLESLADGVATQFLKNPLVSRVDVSVKKEKYAKKPMMGIEISRDRHG
jgi:7,8-dihydroneopterin aldolase/epimerase/oxygenase